MEVLVLAPKLSLLTVQLVGLVFEFLRSLFGPLELLGHDVHL